MNSNSDDQLNAPDPVTELRHELEHSSIGRVQQAEEMSRITDVFIVRHPGLADAFHREFARVCEASGIQKGPELSQITYAPSDEYKTVVSGKSAASRSTGSGGQTPAGIPETIGRCRVLKELGRGGMGMVLLGHDPVLRRRVAIKVLPKEFARDPQLLERFRREATAVTELEHPGIVPIYEIGEQDGLHYYVMRHVDGLSLREWCREQLDADRIAEASAIRHGARALLRTTARRQGRASFSVSGLGNVLRVFEEVARALHHAHEQGIIHRDIKPANVMVDQQGFGQLLDFGLAQIEREATMTRTGLLLGTVAYMAPEQISHALGRVGPRTDVFALGVSLFECLTGTRPFMGDTPEATLHLILSTEPPSPVIFVPELSRDIETIILKCLEKRLERRYASALALAEDLSRVRAHERIEAQPIGPVGRVLRWAERHRASASVAMAGIAAIMVLLAVVVGSKVIHDLDRAEAARKELRPFVAAVQQLEFIGKDRLVLRRELESSFHNPELRQRSIIRREIDELDDKAQKIVAEARAAINQARAIDADVANEEIRLQEGNLRVRLSSFRSCYRTEIGAALETLIALANPQANGPGFGQLSLSLAQANTDVVIHRQVLHADGFRLVPGEEVHRGRGAIKGLRLESGSYIATLTAPGYIKADYPIFLQAGEHWGSTNFDDARFGDKDWQVSLAPVGSYDPDEFVMIPGGPYLATLDRDSYGNEPELVWRWLDSFIIARRELKAAEWRPFISDEIVRLEIEERPDPFRLIYLPRVRPNMPSAHYLDPNVPAADLQKGLLNLKADVDELALAGISQTDALRFCRWCQETGTKNYDLPTADQWEKAARGVDGRLHPWGPGFSWDFVYGPSPATMLGRLPTLASIDRADRSPYGILNMAGHVREWCRDGGELGDGEVNPYLAGGDCSGAATDAGFFMTWPRTFLARDNVAITYGLRPILLGVTP